MPLPKERKFIYSKTEDTLQSEHVTSDFGRRDTPTRISRWHMGIDVNNGLNNTDNGDAIFPIEKGRIILLYVSEGYKVIVIKGKQRFGFGHIFFNGLPDRYKGMRSGDFILMQMTESEEYAIIYCPSGKRPIAFGPQPGYVVHPLVNDGNPLKVNDIVDDLSIPVAPIGTSAGLPAHVHLYNFQEDPGYSDFVNKRTMNHADHNFRNPKDPLEFIEYQPFHYMVSIQDHHLGYPGTLTSSVKVRCAMIDTYGGGVYRNGINDVDQVDLFIKKRHEPDTSFVHIRGATLESRISEGSVIGKARYPSPRHPSNNSYVDISGQDDNDNGSWKRTGILASAYSHNAWDEYFFSDFPLRIHKDHVPGKGNLKKFSQFIDDARFPDGAYQMYASALTVKGKRYLSSIIFPYNILIDNFKPLIKMVIVRRRNIFYSEPTIIYKGAWTWDGKVLDYESMEYLVDVDANNELEIEVSTTEPMLQLEAVILSGKRKIEVMVKPTDENKRNIFKGFIPSFYLKNVKKDSYQLVFTGKDLSGNSLQGMGPEEYSVADKDISVRTSWNSWSVPSKNMDSRHSFQVGYFR